MMLGLGLLLGSAIKTNAPVEQTDVRTNLVADYDFVKTSNVNIVADLSGNNNHAVLGTTANAESSDPTWSNTGLIFDGINDTVVTPVSLNTGTFTHSVVASITGGAGTNRNIVWQRFDGVPKAGWMLYINASNLLAVVKATPSSGMVSAASINPTGWDLTLPNHYVVRFNNGAPTIFVNGQQVWSTTSQDMAYVPTSETIKYSSAFFMPGSIFYSRIYSSSLTDEEVATLHTAIKTKLSNRGVQLPQ